MSSIALLLAAAVSAAGFPDWEGVTDKNYVYGRSLTSAGDLRHKATIVIQVVNDATLAKQLAVCDTMPNRMPALRGTDMVPWEMMTQIPRDSIVLLSVLGKRNDQKIKEAFEIESKNSQANWLLVPTYMNVKLVGDEPEDDRKYPYVYVFGPTGAEPTFKGTLTAANNAQAVKAFRDALAKVDKEWTPKTGVKEVKNFPTVPKLLAAGKYAAAQAAARGGLKHADPAVSTEAQIICDAIDQYRTDLGAMIAAEWSQAPAKAFVDAQVLFKAFPADRKKLQAIEAKMKGDKNVVLMGGILEKIVEWKREGYEPKPAEAKKIVATLTKYKKMLKKISDDTANMRMSTQALVLDGEVDSLLDTMKAKLPSK